MATHGHFHFMWILDSKQQKQPSDFVIWEWTTKLFVSVKLVQTVEPFLFRLLTKNCVSYNNDTRCKCAFNTCNCMYQNCLLKYSALIEGTHHLALVYIKEWWWREGSAVKNTSCAFRELSFSSKHQHGLSTSKHLLHICTCGETFVNIKWSYY